jgi:hypothetical protein
MGSSTGSLKVVERASGGSGMEALTGVLHSEPEIRGK